MRILFPFERAQRDAGRAREREREREREGGEREREKATVMVNWFYYGNARSNKKTRTDKFGGRFNSPLTLHARLNSVRLGR